MEIIFDKKEGDWRVI